MFKILLTNWRL